MPSFPAIVVKAGQANAITVLYDGQSITKDVTAVQVAIWNAGNKAIHRENVLEPVVLKTANGSRILEASIRHTTRNVCMAKLDTSQITEGKLGVEWKILEPSDGMVVQVVYEGSPDFLFNTSGVIEEQGEVIKELKSTPSKGPTSPHSGTRVALWSLLLLFPAMAFSNVTGFREFKMRLASAKTERERSILKIMYYSSHLFIMLAFCYILYLLYNSYLNVPPFEL